MLRKSCCHWRLRRWKNVPNLNVRAFKVHRKFQANHWSRFQQQGNNYRWQNSHALDLGYRGTRTIPIFGYSILSWSRLLLPRLRHNKSSFTRQHRKLEGIIFTKEYGAVARNFPIYGYWKQKWPRQHTPCCIKRICRVICQRFGTRYWSNRDFS